MISCCRSPHSWMTRKKRLSSASGNSWGSLRSFLGLAGRASASLLADVEEVVVAEPLLAGDPDDLGDHVGFRLSVWRYEIGPLSGCFSLIATLSCAADTSPFGYSAKLLEYHSPPPPERMVSP